MTAEGEVERNGTSLIFPTYIISLVIEYTKIGTGSSLDIAIILFLQTRSTVHAIVHSPTPHPCELQKLY